jgi:hypothetical protein
MPILFPDLTSLPLADVAAARALLIQRLQEKSPIADFRRGVLHDLLINLESVIHAAQEIYADKFRKSGSVQAIEADPALADPSLVDRVLSNFLITRKIGTKVRGEVTVVMLSSKASVVAINSVFVAFGKNYKAVSTFAAKISASSLISSTDRLVFPIGDGSYGFNITVEAELEGKGYELKQNDRLEMVNPVGGIVLAFAASDFSNGTDIETNLELISRLREGLASKNFSNKHSLSALIKSNFLTVKDVGSFGFGAPEQIRYHGVFPVAQGGRVDAYIRHDGLPSKTTIEAEASLVEQRLTGGVWQVSFDRETLPGFYEAVRIVRLKDSSNQSIQYGYEVINTIKDFDISDDDTGFSPEIEIAVEAAFTRYQTVTLQFLDTDTSADLAIGTKADYSFTLRGQKSIDAIQKLLNGEDVRPTGSDILVRAAIPFDVKVSMVIHNRNKDYVVPVDLIKNKLFDYVNSMGLGSKLYESNLISVIQNQLTDDQSIDSIELRGRVIYPSGRIRYINGRVSLSVPEDPLNLVTSKNTSYFLDKSDVQVTVKSV